MALTQELPIYRDTYKLILLLFDSTKQFPREYDRTTSKSRVRGTRSEGTAKQMGWHTLGQDIKRDAIQLVRSIYRANRSREKRQYLEEYLGNFELLKLEIRLCKDLKLLSVRRFVTISQLMEQIGKQATGWKKKYQ